MIKYQRKPPNPAVQVQDESDDDSDYGTPPAWYPKRRPPPPPGPIDPADEKSYGNVAHKQRGRTVIQLDNRHVVPYNAFLTMKYDTHINVEYCEASAPVAYVLKYVLKGNAL